MKVATMLVLAAAVLATVQGDQTHKAIKRSFGAETTGAKPGPDALPNTFFPMDANADARRLVEQARMPTAILQAQKIQDESDPTTFAPVDQDMRRLARSPESVLKAKKVHRVQEPETYVPQTDEKRRLDGFFPRFRGEKV